MQLEIQHSQTQPYMLLAPESITAGGDKAHLCKAVQTLAWFSLGAKWRVAIYPDRRRDHA